MKKLLILLFLAQIANFNLKSETSVEEIINQCIGIETQEERPQRPESPKTPTEEPALPPIASPGRPLQSPVIPLVSPRSFDSRQTTDTLPSESDSIDSTETGEALLTDLADALIILKNNINRDPSEEKLQALNKYLKLVESLKPGLVEQDLFNKYKIYQAQAILELFKDEEIVQNYLKNNPIAKAYWQSKIEKSRETFAPKPVAPSAGMLPIRRTGLADLLAGIRAGTTLKKTDSEELPTPKAPSALKEEEPRAMLLQAGIISSLKVNPNNFINETLKKALSNAMKDFNPELKLYLDQYLNLYKKLKLEDINEEIINKLKDIYKKIDSNNTIEEKLKEIFKKIKKQEDTSQDISRLIEELNPSSTSTTKDDNDDDSDWND